MLISRRTALAGVGVLAATSLLPRTARAAEFDYKMGHSSPESHPFHKRLLEVSARIAKESGGRMTLSIFPNSQLGGDNDLLSQCRSGAVDFVQPAGLILAWQAEPEFAILRLNQSVEYAPGVGIDLNLHCNAPVKCKLLRNATSQCFRVILKRQRCYAHGEDGLPAS